MIHPVDAEWYAEPRSPELFPTCALCGACPADTALKTVSFVPAEVTGYVLLLPAGHPGTLPGGNNIY